MGFYALYNRIVKVWSVGLTAILISACGTTSPVETAPPPASSTHFAGLSLPDKTVFNQKDTRWAHHKLGNSADNLGSDGCLVTATAMALGNLGFKTSPADLNARLTAADSFTKKGWLVWSGIEKVTQGRAHARFYDTVSDDIIQGCLRDGYYPLARFYLPNGRSHWSMIVGQSNKGFHMRDPLRISHSPLIFPRGTDGFKAVRCVGLKRA